MEHIKDNKLIAWIIFLISPLLSAIIAVFNFDKKYYRVFLLLFLALYGYTYIPIPNSDVEKHLEYFTQISAYSFNDFFTSLTGIYNPGSRNPDAYLLVVSYLVSRFTSDTGIFLMVVALIYYYVFLKLISYIYSFKEGSKKNRFYILFLIGVAFTWNLSSGINGIRFPLAFMLFVYGALKMVVTREKKYVLVALLSVFIHFALFYSCIFLLLYFVFVPKKPAVLYGFLILAIIFSVSIGSFVQSNTALLGDVVSNKLTAYTNEEYIESREAHLEKVNWYVQFDRYSTYYFAFASLLLSRLKFFRLNFNTTANNLFGFAMIMLIQNLFSGVVVDSISNRFYLLFNTITLIYLFYLGILNSGNKYLFYASRIYSLFLLLHVLLIFRVDLYTMSPILLFGNIFFIFLTKSAISVQDWFL